MGCDIHLYVEVQRDGKWQSADKWTADEDEPGRKTVRYHDRLYTGRSYDTFAILANVRNGSGFAGCDTGDGFKPISEPRGLPADVSPEVAAESESWGPDGHSHSHLTVAELLAYDWTQETKKRGWVSGPEFFEWSRWQRQQGEGPETYSGGVWGQSVQHVTAQEMERRVEDLLKTVPSDYQQRKTAVQTRLADYHCCVEWGTPYYRQAQYFLAQVMPRLWRLGKPEDVRIVFWFDN